MANNQPKTAIEEVYRNMIEDNYDPNSIGRNVNEFADYLANDDVFSEDIYNYVKQNAPNYTKTKAEFAVQMLGSRALPNTAVSPEELEVMLQIPTIDFYANKQNKEISKVLPKHQKSTPLSEADKFNLKTQIGAASQRVEDVQQNKPFKFNNKINPALDVSGKQKVTAIDKVVGKAIAEDRAMAEMTTEIADYLRDNPDFTITQNSGLSESDRIKYRVAADRDNTQAFDKLNKTLGLTPEQRLANMSHEEKLQVYEQIHNIEAAKSIASEIEALKKRLDDAVEERAEKYAEKLRDTRVWFEDPTISHMRTQAAMPTDYLSPAIQQLKQAQEIITAPDKNSSGWGAFFKGMKDGVDIGDIVTMGLGDLANNLLVKSVVDKYEKDPDSLRDDEQLLLDAIALNTSAQILFTPQVHKRYFAGKGGTESLAFMAQMLATGGIGRGASGALTKAIGKYLIRNTGKIAQRLALKGLGRTAMKAGLGLANSTVSAAAMTPFMPQTYNNMLEQQTGVVHRTAKNKLGEPMEYDMEVVSKDIPLRNSILDSGIEVFSEMLGGHIGKGFGLAGKGFVKGLNKAIPKLVNSTLYQRVLRAGRFLNTNNELLNKYFAKQGFVEENVEEFAGNALRYITGVSTLDELKEQFSGEGVVNQMLSLAPVSVIGLGANNLNQAKIYYDKYKAEKSLRGTLKGYGLKQNEVDYFVANVMNGTSEEASKSVSDLINKAGGTKNNGMLNDTGLRISRQVVDYIFKSARSEAAKAYTAEQEQRAKEHRNSQVQTIQGLKGHIAFSEKDNKAEEAEHQEIRNAVDDISNETTGKTTVIEQKDGTQLYVVKGNIVTNDDGTIDMSKSDKVLIVKEQQEDGSLKTKEYNITADTNLGTVVEDRAKEDIYEAAIGQRREFARNEAEYPVGSVVVDKISGATSRVKSVTAEGIVVDTVNERTGERAEALIPIEQAQSLFVTMPATEEGASIDISGDGNHAVTVKSISPDGVVTAAVSDIMNNIEGVEVAYNSVEEFERAIGMQVAEYAKSAENQLVSENNRDLQKNDVSGKSVSTDEYQGVRGEGRDEILDEKGLPFVKASSGKTDFGYITANTGLKPAPIKLSTGDKRSGLQHIEEKHGEQIAKAGFRSVVDFVEYVADNYDTIAEGVDISGYHNGTYLLQARDNHDNTLYIELSNDGGYWNINSGGVFRQGYGKKNKVVWSASEVQRGSKSTTLNTLQSQDKVDNQSDPNRTVSDTTSQDKDTTNSFDTQEDFYSTLPKDKRGEIDEAQMTAEQKIRYAEYELGDDKAELSGYIQDQSTALAKQISALNKKESKSIAERKRLVGLKADKAIFDEYLNKLITPKADNRGSTITTEKRAEKQQIIRERESDSRGENQGDDVTRDIRFKTDRAGNSIGDGSFHVPYYIINLDKYPQVVYDVSFSNTTESVYVNYQNTDNDKSVTVRFSNHENNATKFGDQLDGNWAKDNEILYALGLKNRVFIPEKRKDIGAYQVKKKEAKAYEEADKTIQEIYSLPVGTDLSAYKGKRAKSNKEGKISNWIITGDVVSEVGVYARDFLGNSVPLGRYEYEDIARSIAPEEITKGVTAYQGSPTSGAPRYDRGKSASTKDSYKPVPPLVLKTVNRLTDTKLASKVLTGEEFWQRLSDMERAAKHNRMHAKTLQSPLEVRDINGVHKVIDLNNTPELNKYLFQSGDKPNKSLVKEFNNWLKENADKYVRLYHGTSSNNPIQEQGIKRTTQRNKKSFQSRNGYVYLSRFPDTARFFGEMNNYGDTTVYAVDVKIKDLLPDLDQINNKRSLDFGIGNTLADSLVYGNGARVKRDVGPYELSPTKFYVDNIKDYERQLQAIKERAIAEGTFMKAPNGKATNLNERQWLQVRTPEFKRWFGDWEKAARIEKLKESEAVEVAFNGEYELSRDSAKAYIKDNLRDEYLNKDTNEKIRVSRVGANKVTSHGERDEAHLKSIVSIPQMISNAIFIEELSNQKGNNKYETYRYYVVGLKIAGIDYTAKIVVGKRGNAWYYDHDLTQIEKGTLINATQSTNSLDKNQIPLSEYKDSKLISLLQTNSSKVVDENGEPRVVYHGTNADFTKFQPSDSGSMGKGIYLTSDKNVAYQYANRYGGNTIIESFVNIKNPIELDTPYSPKPNVVGKDGVIAGRKHGTEATEIVVFHPTQIKSATGNVGTFDETDGDIRYQAVWHGSPHDFDKFSLNHIGTGEGSQAYGWGLYFTDIEEIAKQYAKRLDLGLIKNLTISGIPLYKNGNPIYYDYREQGEHLAFLQEQLFANEQLFDEKLSDTEMLKGVQDWFDNNIRLAQEDAERDGYYNGYVAVLKKHSPNKLSDIQLERNKDRNMYRVKIHGDKSVDELNFLRWDKPVNKELFDLIYKADSNLSERYFHRSDSVPYDGEMLYNALSHYFNSDKEASLFLLRVGIDGIKYPTGYQSRVSHEDSFNYVVFDENALEIDEHIRFLRYPSGTIYGFVDSNNVVYLNSDVLNLNTPIHEFGHLWVSQIRNHFPDVWDKGNELFANSTYLKEVQVDPNYRHLNLDQQIDEAMARAIGDNGEREVSKTLFEKIIDWIADVWKRIGSRFGIENLTAEQISKLTLKDFTDIATSELLSGKDLTARVRTRELIETNERFNSELEKQVKGELPKGHVYKLGMPSDILRSAGLPDLPIELSSTRLNEKSKQDNHPFDLSEVKNLPNAIQNPLAVFRSATRIGSFVVMTEVEHDEKNFVVAIEADRAKGHIRINDIRSIHYRSSNTHFANWLTEGLAEYIDKKRMAEWLSKQRYNSAEVRKLFNHAAKVIKDFENPTFFEGKSDDIRFSIADRAKDVVNKLSDKKRGEPDIIKAINKQVNSIAVRTKETYADQHRAVKVMYDELKKRGINVTDRNNYYMQVTATQSKIETETRKYKEEILFPLIKKLHNITETIKVTDEEYSEYEAKMKARNSELERNGVQKEKVLSRDEYKFRKIEDYVMLKHGLERNEYMRNQDKQINKRDDYAGIGDIVNSALLQRHKGDMTAASKEQVETFERDLGDKVIGDLWQNINEATEYTLNTEYKSGFITKDTYNKVRSMYKYYVPLRGHDDTTASDIMDYTKPTGSGNGQTPTAKGRTSRAFAPFATIEQMAHRAIANGKRNELNKSIFRLANTDTNGLMYVANVYEDKEGNLLQVELNKDMSPDEVKEACRKFKKDMSERVKAGEVAVPKGRVPSLGLFVSPDEARQHAVRVFDNGRAYDVIFNTHVSIPRAINGTNVAPKYYQDNVIGEGIVSITRAMSKNMTSRRPAFVFKNGLRDYRYAVVGIAAREGMLYQKAFHNHLFGRGASESMMDFITGRRTLYGWSVAGKRSSKGTEYDKLLAEFVMNGGRTGISQIMELKKRQKNLTKMVDTGKIDSKSVIDYTFGLVEGASEYMENITRFAAYCTSRQMGRSIERSISDAKELTVNFDRRGAGNKFMSAVFPVTMFANASIQALLNYKRRLIDHTEGGKWNKGQLYAGIGIMVQAMAFRVLNLALSELWGDSEDEYSKLSKWDRQNNVCLLAPHGFVKIPIPQELRLWYKIGDEIMDVANGGRPETAALNMVLAATDLLPTFVENPIPLDDLDRADLGKVAVKNIVSNIAPISPIVETMFNLSFTNNRIYDDNKYGSQKKEVMPEWTKALTWRDGTTKTPDYIVWFAKGLNALTGGDDIKQGAIDINPDKINHIARGYLGGIYDVIGTVMEVASNAISEDDDVEVSDFKTASAFFVPKSKYRLGDQILYDRFQSELKGAKERVAIADNLYNADRADEVDENKYALDRAYLDIEPTLKDNRIKADKTKDAKIKEALYEFSDKLMRAVRDLQHIDTDGKTPEELHERIGVELDKVYNEYDYLIDTEETETP